MSDNSVVRWLLDSDPAIRWQVKRDLLDASGDEVAAERARVATEGWGARVLSAQAADGTWGGVAWNPGFSSTMHALWVLRSLGVDPASDPVRQAMEHVREHVTWEGCGPEECNENRFFEGEIEPCINGQVAAAGAYLGQDVHGIVDRLLAEQLDDGGWNCDAERGSTRSSYNTTICVVEALLEHERQVGDAPTVTEARRRGQEYLLERHLFRRKSTGEVIPYDRHMGPESGDGHPAWTRFAFPTWWHYDVLRGLEHLRAAGVPPDTRMDEAIELVRSKRDADGRWPLEVCHPGEVPVDFGETVGEPSRWMTLRALRVLDWYETEAWSASSAR